MEAGYELDSAIAITQNSDTLIVFFTTVPVEKTENEDGSTKLWSQQFSIDLRVLTPDGSPVLVHTFTDFTAGYNQYKFQRVQILSDDRIALIADHMWQISDGTASYGSWTCVLNPEGTALVTALGINGVGSLGNLTWVDDKAYGYLASERGIDLGGGEYNWYEHLFYLGDSSTLTSDELIEYFEGTFSVNFEAVVVDDRFLGTASGSPWELLAMEAHNNSFTSTSSQTVALRDDDDSGNREIWIYDIGTDASTFVSLPDLDEMPGEPQSVFLVTTMIAQDSCQMAGQYDNGLWSVNLTTGDLTEILPASSLYHGDDYTVFNDARIGVGYAEADTEEETPYFAYSHVTIPVDLSSVHVPDTSYELTKIDGVVRGIIYWIEEEYDDFDELITEESVRFLLYIGTE